MRGWDTDAGCFFVVLRLVYDDVMKWIRLMVWFWAFLGGGVGGWTWHTHCIGMGICWEIPVMLCYLAAWWR